MPNPQAPSSSDGSSDIEVIDIHIASSAVNASDPETDFIWRELTGGCEVITIETVRSALAKYDVFASDTQLVDMIALSNGEAFTRQDLSRLLGRLFKGRES